MIGRNDINLRIGATDKTAPAFRSAEIRMKTLAGSAKMMAGALGMGISAATIIRSTKAVIDHGSAITDAAAATRVGIEEYQVLAYAAREAGAEMGNITTALAKIQKATNDASNGLTTYTRAFDQLNINIDEFMQLSPDRQFERLGIALVQSKDQARSYASILDIIGSRNAPRLMEVLKRLGNEGFGTVSEAAKEAGQVMREETAKSMDAMADAMAELDTGLKNWWAESVVRLSGNFDIGGEATKIAQLTVEIEKMEQKLSRLKTSGRNPLEKFLIWESGDQGEITRTEYKLKRLRSELTSLTEQAVPDQEKITKAVTVTADEYSRWEKILWAIPDGIQLGAVAAEEAINAYEAQKSIGERTTDALRDRVVAASDDMSDAFMTWAQTGKFAFKDMANSIIQDMVRIMIQQRVTTPLATRFGDFLFGSKDSGGGGFFGAIGSAFASGGAKAAGGSVYAGRSYLVGEKGPEIMTTRSNGTIIPNEDIGGGQTIIKFEVTAIDSASFSQHLATHRKEITGIVESAYSRRGKRGPLTV